MGTSDKYSDLIAEFQKRFPLISKVEALFGEDIPSESIPCFFGFFLAAAEKRGPGTCCFILDKTSATTVLASALWALINFQKNFPDLVRRHTQNSFSLGDRVRVKPNNYVYEYDGIWEECPSLFRLKVLDSERDKRSFPLEDVMRLETTDRLRPKGKLNSKLGNFERSPLGHLLGLHEPGNRDLIENKTLVLMEQTKFERFADSMVLAPPHLSVEQFQNLSSLLSTGSIASDGTLKSKDGSNPVVAVTSSPEYLSLACLEAQPATKVVFVDGVKRIVGNLQAFDDISRRQNMIILAAADEEEYIDQLRERGCTVWRMSPEEILLGEDSTRSRAHASLVGATVRAANIRLHRKITEVDCEDSLIQQVAVFLESAWEMVRHDEENSEAVKMVRDIRGVLFDCSECCLGVGEGTASKLAAMKNHFTEHGKYLEGNVRNAIGKAIDGLESLVENGGGRSKAEKLQGILSEIRGRWGIAVRSVRTAECLRGKLGPQGGFEIKRFSEIRPESEYAGIIVPAWPYRWNFVRLIRMAVAPDIRILVYPFEKELVLSHKRLEKNRSRSGLIGREERSLILDVELGLLPETRDEKTDNQGAPRREMEIKESSLLDFENRIVRRPRSHPIGTVDDRDAREARAVHFFGGCHAFLTEWAQLPVLNELVYKSEEDNPKLLSKKPAELSPGDFVLFRAGGDKEFVRLIAERILGEEQYAKTRDTAELWKQALGDLGDSPEVVSAELAKYGISKSLPTLGNWLRNPDLIAPQKYSDIEAIACATDHSELVSRKDEITLAIKTIRDAHRSAGRELSRLILGGLRSSRLRELDEQPVLQDFGYGGVYDKFVGILLSTGRTASVFPPRVESIAHYCRFQSNNRIGSRNSPVHPAPLKSVPYNRFTASLNHTGRNTESHPPEFRVIHTMTVVVNVIDAFPRLLMPVLMLPERLYNLVQLSSVKLIHTLLCPLGAKIIPRPVQ